MKSSFPQQGKLSPSQLQSESIDLLRFPLAIMVIFIHMKATTTSIPDADFPINSYSGIYNLIAIIFSHGISAVAVPTFYLISGYLFFIKCSIFSVDTYKYKMKRRIHSLIVPYLLWNIIAFLLSLICLSVVAKSYNSPIDIDNVENLLSGWWHCLYDCHNFGDRINGLGCIVHVTGPHDFPLWFLRDLIIVSMLTPIIYLWIKHLKIYGIIILYIAYCTNIWISIQGFSIVAFFYFSLGAYLSINQHNITTIAQRYKGIIIPVTLIALAFACYYDGSNTVIGQKIVPIYTLFGTFTTFYIASVLIQKHKIKPNKLLVSSCFFVYALHTIGEIYEPRYVSSRILHAIIPENIACSNIVCFMLSPGLTAAICVAIYILCRSISPKLTRILSGNK